MFIIVTTRIISEFMADPHPRPHAIGVVMSVTVAVLTQLGSLRLPLRCRVLVTREATAFTEAQRLVEVKEEDQKQDDKRSDGGEESEGFVRH